MSQYLHFDELGDVQIVGSMDNLIGDEANLSSVNSAGENIPSSENGDSTNSNQALGNIDDSLISLQQVRSESPGFEEVIIVQPAEEIIIDEPISQANPVVGSDQVLVPLSDPLADQDSETPSSFKTKKSRSNKRSKKNDSSFESDQKMARRWEQRQVQIKTLEGEFSVTMWASGRVSPSIY